MSEPTRYGLLLDEWDAAKADIREKMIQVAKLHTTITYGDLAAQLTTIAPHPGAYVFHALLREVCSDERKAGRGNLCAVVVSKAKGIPGQGFFKMLIQHGVDCTDVQACWETEIARLYEIWGE